MILGIVIVTYGLTRWLVSSNLIGKQIRILEKYGDRWSGERKLVFAIIQTAAGTYQWADGAIFCCAIGSSFLFTAYYLSKPRNEIIPKT
jgi:hypothetical protein